MTTLIPKFQQLGQTNAGVATAVNRPFNEKLQEYVSVKDFGAYGDGKHDDTAAIQAAIDAAGLTLTAGVPPATNMGGNRPPPVVMFPPGCYRIINSLTLYTGMVLMGQNDLAYTVESTRIVMDTATNAPVATGNELGGVVNLDKNIINTTRTYTPTGTVLSNNVTVTIANIGFWILNPNGTIAQRGGIGWSGPATGSAIYFSEPTNDSRIKRCNFYSVPNAAIYLDGGTGSAVAMAMEIHETEFDTPIMDIRLRNVTPNLVLNQNIFFAGTYQIYGVDVGEGQIIATNNTFQYSSRVKLFPSTLSLFQYTGNTNDGAGSTGTTLDLNTVERINIVGNTFGLDVESSVNVLGATGGVIANNTFVNSGYNQTIVGPTTDGGAIRLSGCQNVVVEGNSILTPGAATYGGFGIVSLPSGAVEGKNIFSNNFVSGSYTGSLYRNQSRRINVCDTDIVSDNYTGNPDTVTPEWRIHDGWGGQLSLYRQSEITASAAYNFDVSKFAQAKFTYHFAAVSTTDNLFLEVLVGRRHTTGAYVILNVSKDGVAGAGNGPHTVSAGNTVTFSISGTNLVSTYAITTDPILTSLQFSGAKR